MNHTHKPYRLLKKSELQRWSEEGEKINTVFTDFATTIKCQVAQVINTPSLKDPMTISQGKTPLVLIEQDGLKRVQRMLLNDESPHPTYRAFSKHVLLDAFSQLLVLDELNWQSTGSLSSWFYPGSSCLKVTLASKNHEVDSFIHPACVHKTIDSPQKSCCPMVPVDKALACQPVNVSVQLPRTSMTVSEFSQLIPGDVIQLAASCEDSLTLYFEDIPLARGSLGKQNQHRALKLNLLGEEHDK